MAVTKSTALFPTFDEALKSSMLQGVQLFLKNVVLAANADVRSFYDSNQTFVDAKLATLYGVGIRAPASGFGQVQLPASSGRAGILGQPASSRRNPKPTAPLRRDEAFHPGDLLCTTPPPPPPGIVRTFLSTRRPRRANYWSSIVLI